MAQAKKNLTFVLMDAPYENARTVTALRLIDIAVQRGHDVTVFAYEGAVSLAFAKQAKHANAVHGRSVEEEDHPLPREWIEAVLATAQKTGSKVDWINCGLCVDERGVAEAVPGTRRGSPADLWKAAEASDNTLVIGAR
jgi:tRNA 2-thiouridine synthesizing protein D